MKNVSRIQALLLTLVALSSMFLSACKEEANVNVSCGDLQKYKGEIGYLNLPSFELGNIIYLNTETRKAFYLSTATIEENSILTEPAGGKLIDAYEPEIDVVFEIALPDNIKEDIRSNIQKLTELEVSNFSRTYLQDPVATIDNDRETLMSIFRTIDENNIERGKFIIVSSIINADSAALRASEVPGRTPDSSLISYDRYKLSVSYQCNDSLQQLTGKGGPFFKFTPVKVIKNDNIYTVVLDQDFDIDITEYELATVFM